MASATAAKSPLHRFFRPGGTLANAHPAFESRPGQLQMALAVEDALANTRKLIVEAGTGTGKTMAYLVPALLSGRRVVISTGTKALQEQLYFRDVPFLEGAFGKKLRVCYMKGRNNYACRQKIYDQADQPALSGLEEYADFQVIRDWEQSTETGDRAEIRTLPEQSGAWAKIDARTELCAGPKCKQYERCFITLMHQRAAEADIVIVNHHLFFADLALRRSEVAQILPNYDAVIFDEAHEIEDTAGNYFGFAISTWKVQELRRDAAVISRARKFGSEELDRILERIDEIALHFFSLLPGAEGRLNFEGREEFVKEYRDLYQAMLSAFDLLASHLQLIQEAPHEVAPLIRRAKETRGALEFLWPHDAATQGHDEDKAEPDDGRPESRIAKRGRHDHPIVRGCDTLLQMGKTGGVWRNDPHRIRRVAAGNRQPQRRAPRRQGIFLEGCTVLKLRARIRQERHQGVVAANTGVVRKGQQAS